MVMNEDELVKERLYQIATAVCDDCFSAAVTAYENARIDGLCHDGAWECALEAMRAMDFEAIMARATSQK